MPMQHGFEVKIKGRFFVERKSADGADVIVALEEALDIRTKIQAMLLDLPVNFDISEPRWVSRRAPDLFSEGKADTDSAPTLEAVPDDAA